MSALESRPKNLNFLSQVGFKFEIARAPNFNYFIQKVQFPGVTLPVVFQPTPFVKNPLPGDHIDYDTLKISFKMDENFKGYFELYDWIVALSKPDNFNQSKTIYKKPTYEKDGVYSQGKLILLSSDMNPNLEITFQDMLPTQLSGFTLESDTNDVQYITAEIAFAYRAYKYEYLT